VKAKKPCVPLRQSGCGGGDSHKLPGMCEVAAEDVRAVLGGAGPFQFISRQVA